MTATIAAKHNLKLWRIDFVGAYLNSLTKEDIYMKQPEGFVEPGYEDYVAKLVHTIYGTMQGGHDWYETLGTTFDELGYTTSRADPCVRLKEGDGKYTITDTYTDDVFGASKNDEEIKERKDKIRAIHECTRELTRTRTCEYFNSKSRTRTRANLFPRVTCTREPSTHELQVHPPSLYQKWQ